MDVLPDDVIARIFAYLDVRSLCRTRSVCKRFDHLVCDDRCWEHLQFISAEAYEFFHFLGQIVHANTKSISAKIFSEERRIIISRREVLKISKQCTLTTVNLSGIVGENIQRVRLELLLRHPMQIRNLKFEHIKLLVDGCGSAEKFPSLETLTLGDGCEFGNKQSNRVLGKNRAWFARNPSDSVHREFFGFLGNCPAMRKLNTYLEYIPRQYLNHNLNPRMRDPSRVQSVEVLNIYISNKYRLGYPLIQEILTFFSSLSLLIFRNDDHQKNINVTYGMKAPAGLLKELIAWFPRGESSDEYEDSEEDEDLDVSLFYR